MRSKNIFLIFVSLLLMVGISGLVNAVDGVNASVTSITQEAGTGTASALSRFDYVYHLRNGSYLINFTIQTLNTSGESANLTAINISLPSVFTWGGGNRTGIDLAQFSTNTTGGVTVLRWNRTNNLFDADEAANFSSFVFNVTLANSSAADGIYNFTIWAEYNASKSAMSFNIRNNITVDNTRPVLASAATHSVNATQSVNTTNITFTETNGILGSTFDVGDFNVTTEDFSKNLTVLALNGSSAGNKTITVVLTAFSKNQTPIIRINWTGLSLTDYAGNNITGGQSVTSVDRVRPSLLTKGIEYNYSTRNLTLIFDEPIYSTNIYVAGIVLYDNATGAGVEQIIALNDGNVSAYSVYAGSMNKTVIQISDVFRDKILGWKPNAQGLNISLTTATFNDTSNNSVYVVGNQSINIYTLDTTGPSLFIITYNHSSRVMNFTFSETIDASTFNTSKIFIGNQANLSMINLSNQVVLNGSVSSTNTTSVLVTLTESTAGNLSEWRVGTLYIYTNYTEATAGYTINDLSGQNMTLIRNDTALGYINSSTYTNDSAAPGLRIAILLNDSSPTKEGNVTFVVYFNERMDRGNTINVTFHPNETTNVYTIIGAWTNYSQWNGSFTLNKSWNAIVGDGIAIINVSGARDLAYNTITANKSNTFIIDTTLPTLSMVWYNDTNYDYNESTGEQLGTDFLVLKFSENVTVASANDTTIIYLANESGLGYAFEGNSSASQGAIFVRDVTDYNKINAAINNTMKPWVRGTYNATGKVQGIIVKNATISITDEAGNPLSNSTGVKDIYDHAMTWTADVNGQILWKGLSVPHDVSSTATWAELDKYTSVVYTHNGTAWIQATSSSNDFIPLRGYLVKITGATENRSIDIPIQTDLRGSQGSSIPQTDLSQYTTSVKIDDGAYSLVGVNGYLDNLATDQNADAGFLASIGGPDGNNQVNSIQYADEVNTNIGTPGLVTANKLVPYRAYWIWTNGITGGSSDYYSFNGYSDKNLI